MNHDDNNQNLANPLSMMCSRYPFGRSHDLCLFGVVFPILEGMKLLIQFIGAIARMIFTENRYQ